MVCQKKYLNFFFKRSGQGQYIGGGRDGGGDWVLEWLGRGGGFSPPLSPYKARENPGFSKKMKNTNPPKTGYNPDYNPGYNPFGDTLECGQTL